MAVNSGMESVAERSMRSIFVRNIPHEASEEKLKELFTEFGPIINVKFFKDSISMCAFCEYGEQEIALRAIRKLTNYELKGRVLKVDIAGSERSKEEIESLQDSSAVEIDMAQVADGTSEKAPEEISKAVASLPAEQMFELMKQMKMCIENNPQEARNLLLQNPQLAFALLQAQVIMRIVDPEVAMQVLNRPTTPPVDVKIETESAQQSGPTLNNQPEVSSGDQDFRQPSSVDLDMRSQILTGDKDMRIASGDSDMRIIGSAGAAIDKRLDPRFRSSDPRASQNSDPRIAPGGNTRSLQGTDPRVVADPRVATADPRGMSTDPRMIQSADPRMMSAADPRMMPGTDPRMMSGTDPRMMPGTDPRMMPGTDPRMMSGTDPRMMSGTDPRMMPGTDPRMMTGADPRTMATTDPRTLAGVEHRALSSGDPRALSSADPRMMGSESRVMPGVEPRVMPGSDPRVVTGADPGMMQGLDPRMIQGSDPRIISISDPRSLPNADARGISGTDPRSVSGTEVGSRMPPGSNFGPRPSGNSDPRRASTTSAAARMPSNTKAAVSAPPTNVTGISASTTPTAVSSGSSSIPEDEEKAALIMQVLQLSEEQIAQLPPEQRQSIIVLKEQIARSQLAL